jgi:flagellar protein FliS
MAQASLFQQYKSQSLETLTRGEIVVKLFEEASKQISRGIFLKKSGETVQSFNCIAKAQKVISTLNSSLDHQYSISTELSDMYLFLHEQLGKANTKGDTELMKQLLALVDDLKVTFKQAEKLARIQK